MKKLLMSLVLAVASVSSFAAISTDGLTEAQRKEIEQSVQKLKSENSGNSANTSANIRKEVSAWAEIGTNVGQAMVAAAKELGVAATSFAETPLGKITVAIVVFNLIGGSLAKIVIAFTCLVIGIGLFIVARNMAQKREVLYTFATKPVLFGLFNRTYVESSRPSGQESSYGEAGFIGLAIGCLVFVIALANI